MRHSVFGKLIRAIIRAPGALWRLMRQQERPRKRDTGPEFYDKLRTHNRRFKM